MTVKIVFFKSSSKYYDSACAQCKIFGSYAQNKSENTIVTNWGEIRDHYEEMRHLLYTIGNWTRTEYYIDDEKVPLKCINLIMEILACETQCHKCAISDEYCYEKTGWGCRFINSITLCHKPGALTYSNVNWYELGNFFDGIWTIDKDWLFEKLINEVKEKYIDICSCFSLRRLENAIKELPDQIAISDSDECEWEYKYRDAPVGMKPTEKIGVRPRPKPSFSLGNIHDISKPRYNETIEKLRAYAETKEPSAEKDQMLQLIALLEMITKEQIHMEKGQFSPYVHLIECHPWLFESVAGTILSWMFSRSWYFV